LQREGLNKLYRVIENAIPKNVISNKNRNRSWLYGYNEKYDLVVISKTGQIEQVIEVNGLLIALPKAPKSLQRDKDYWERKQLPKPLSQINSIFQWNTMPDSFKSRWVDFIEDEFDKRELGYWFVNDKVPTYITGAHYMYLQWTSIDVGYPEFREANRIFYIYWEACRADHRCFGMIYLKIRRSGFSYMGSSECVNTGTLAKDSRVGILSKTGSDAKKMFTDKVVPISNRLPFFFKPIQDGMDKPKTELAFRIPAAKITKKNMYDIADEELYGLDTTIDWKNTDDNSYDGEKLLLLVHDESGKWLKPNNILNNWRVTKTCLRLGSRIIGKCMMGSTSNALNKGGKEFKKLFNDSNPHNRSKNGQTKSGLYSLFIPMEWNFEGYIDKYGMPIEDVVEYWEAEVESLKNDPDALNEFYRQFPRTESHAFRDESKQALFNLNKLYQQIDYNDSLIQEHHITQGSFYWKGGVVDSEVVWRPDLRGRFKVSWLPPKHLQNRIVNKKGTKYPANEHIGAFGCDSYDISGTVGGGASNGALHGLTKFNVDDAPSNQFFLEYVARPQTAEIFFEEVLMACIFYGMPILVENNKPRLLYHFKNRGYRGFSINRPDKAFNRLSKTERELGGIPNSSEDVKQAHAAAIESYIETHVGLVKEDEMGYMPFNRTLEDWAKFDISNRTRFDASISSGLAIMATQKHKYQPEKKQSNIIINFARYNNKGNLSEIIR
tara:strand:- start:4160 stop:6322 length:2163 start_codon:yes stop_codon:yes gene_type:complete